MGHQLILQENKTIMEFKIFRLNVLYLLFLVGKFGGNALRETRKIKH